MLVHHLCHRVPKQHHILIKRLNLTLQLDAIDQVDRHGNVLAPQLVKERVLQELAFVVAHDMLRVQRVLLRVRPYHTTVRVVPTGGYSL